MWNEWKKSVTKALLIFCVVWNDLWRPMIVENVLMYMWFFLDDFTCYWFQPVGNIKNKRIKKTKWEKLMNSIMICFVEPPASLGSPNFLRIYAGSRGLRHAIACRVMPQHHYLGRNTVHPGVITSSEMTTSEWWPLHKEIVITTPETRRWSLRSPVLFCLYVGMMPTWKCYRMYYNDVSRCLPSFYWSRRYL